MCGIFGVVFSSNSGGVWKDTEAIQNLMYINALRGMDSTGIAMLDNEGGLRLTKAAIPAAEFIETPEWSSIRSQLVSRGKALIGHNRKKTVGSISDETAHPFLIDNRHAFIHNGTLYGHEKLAKTEVDSEALGMHLTKSEGDTTKLSEALYDVFGAYACAWIDKDKEMLYMLRNKDRPLSIGKWIGGWAFCSEPGFLQLAFGRHGLPVSEVKEVPLNTLVSFDLSKHAPQPVFQEIPVKKHTATPIPPIQGSGQSTDGQFTISKNQFKRISKKGLVGTTIKFGIDDWVEKIPGDEKNVNWHIMGESKELAFTHVIHGELKETTESDLKDFYADLDWQGTITSLVWDAKQKLVNISVKNLEPIWTTTTIQ